MAKTATKTATKKTGTKHVSTTAPKKQAAAPTPAAPAKQAVVPETTGKKVVGKKASIPALALKVIDGATNPARPTSKRHAWINAIMGAKTVQAALETKMPDGIEPVNMSHVTWCIKAKLVRTEPLGTK